MAKRGRKPAPRERWPEKAYKNLPFLNSPDARTVRVLCEFLEPQARFRRQKVRDTVVFFGSARTPEPEAAARRLEELEAALRRNPGCVDEDALAQAKRNVEMSRYYADAAELAERLTRWSQARANNGHRFVVCSGGGPGIMEAANRGATPAGGRTISLNISLPHEQVPNPYQTHDLAFEFHYFFVRKFWFVYLAKALIVFPGGYGTMDELFEVLTLLQTHKTRKEMPVVVYGSSYWKEVLNLDAMLKWGMICAKDLDLIRFCDTVDEAFDYLTAELQRIHL